ncbi:hypothetical protein TWF102_003750 [Orbilia oligospora]|uniref:Uncharacterized protein n=1 Tax=Orbilia oligospora TaxID=2813651 RepID=A0A7C8JH63_ORBOL|nr:hypothetical protein TWF102_003750 [Orbilia oligospora]KAF3105260.1 hypothetical protein TWF103_006719 [Orbilia oligospora]KAF3152434.1 hypothetical protein TWF594_004121 [Orbilia oligospora]
MVGSSGLSIIEGTTPMSESDVPQQVKESERRAMYCIEPWGTEIPFQIVWLRELRYLSGATSAGKMGSDYR